MKNVKVQVYELNVTRLRVELAKIDKNYSWLAEQMGVTRQYIHSEIKKRSVSRVEDFAKILGVDEEDLTITAIPF